jgi:hypothetical protein
MENSERVWKIGSAGDWPATRPPTGLAERGYLFSGSGCRAATTPPRAAAERLARDARFAGSLCAAGRGATRRSATSSTTLHRYERGHEGSRGLSAFAARQSAASARRRQSTEGWVLWLCVAERRLNGSGPIHRSAVAPRRRIVCLAAVRGLKPAATIVVSLRETNRKCPRPADQNGGEPRCKRPFSLLDLKPALVRSGESRDGTGGWPAGRLCYPDQRRVQFANRARHPRHLQQHLRRDESLHESAHRPATILPAES